ncbi:mitophagy protein ATG32 [Saccharomyces paradoxus]|uniref:Mitophagy protein ATG32 n=1 Tax=Saccharomyces paradoxus TaxID=27291 RepID=A0A8B8UT51_SACPA|nr:Atg32 [Saccharomyces paradoxus]QHS73876.1 Atg32 [Saccharomyces paradoxus]
MVLEYQQRETKGSPSKSMAPNSSLADIRTCPEAQTGEDKGLLDPHLSVLELLSKTGHSPSPMGQSLVTSIDISSHHNVNDSISGSWQAIQPLDLGASFIPERCSSQTTNGSILSSSDTSEEEQELLQAPAADIINIIKQGQEGANTVSSSHPFRQLQKVISLPMPGKEETPYNEQDDDDEDEAYEEDSVTITKSLTSSTNSFVMPKLSLSQKNPVFRLLILGRTGSNFYQSIPKEYQSLFELPKYHDSATFPQYTGIVIIFQELREMVSLLNRIVQYSQGKPIIPICQPGQVIQVKNVLKSFLRNKLVKLLFPPVVVANKRDLKKMFQRLQDLSLEYAEDVNEEGNDDEGIRAKSRSYYRNKKADSSKRKSPKSNKKPKKKKQRFFTSWFSWGISITIGISFGCCVTYFVTAAYEHQTVKSLNLRSSIFASLLSLDSSSDTVNTHATTTPSSSEQFLWFDKGTLQINFHTDGFIMKSLTVIKETWSKMNDFVLHALSKPLNFLENLNKSSEFSIDESNRILALGYILL